MKVWQIPPEEVVIKALERSWNAAAATGGEHRQCQDREIRATSDHWRAAGTRGKPRCGTVTPEVAGSSPVAPVFRSACKYPVCVVFLDATDAAVAQTRGPND
jgi:hypothetical protein